MVADEHGLKMVDKFGQAASGQPVAAAGELQRASIVITSRWLN